jgi:hypothetical protein
MIRLRLFITLLARFSLAPAWSIESITKIGFRSSFIQRDQYRCKQLFNDKLLQASQSGKTRLCATLCSGSGKQVFDEVTGSAWRWPQTTLAPAAARHLRTYNMKSLDCS